MPRRFWLIAVALLLVGCDVQTKLNGHVIDSSGNPIKGASVWLIYSNWEPMGEKTDDKGDFEVTAVHGSPSDQLVLLISAPGHKLLYRTLTSKPTEKQTFVLQQGAQTELSVTAK